MSWFLCFKDAVSITNQCCIALGTMHLCDQNRLTYVFQWHIWHILPNCFYFNFNIKKLKILIINKSNYNFSPCFCSLFFFNYNFFIKYVPLYTLSSNKIDKILLSYQVKLKILIIIKKSNLFWILVKRNIFLSCFYNNFDVKSNQKFRYHYRNHYKNDIYYECNF